MMKREFKSVLDRIEQGELQVTKAIGHVDYYLISKTAYSFHFYAVYSRNGKPVLTEMLYDLRNKEYFICRNGSEVRFNTANLDLIIPRELDGGYSHSYFNSQGAIDQFLAMVSVDENVGMYAAMLRAIGAIGEERASMTSRALIRLISGYNKLELLYKAGVPIGDFSNRMFREYVNNASINDIRKVHQIFGLSKSQYKFMQEFSGSIGVLCENAYHAKYLTQQDMDRYRGYPTYIAELEEKYNLDDRLNVFKRSASFYSFIDASWRKNTAYGAFNDRDFFGFINQYNHPNPNKLIEYLLFECYLSQGMDFSVALGQYTDYYRMCVELEYTRFDKYPKYLKTFHDIVARNHNAVKDEVANSKFVRATEVYKHLETELGEYAIIVPDNPQALVTEGNVLQHCVGSYIKKVAEGSSRIVFLRKKEEIDEPLVTVELRGDEIVQVRGQANRMPTEDEVKAMKRFAKKQELKLKSFV